MPTKKVSKKRVVKKKTSTKKRAKRSAASTKKSRPSKTADVVALAPVQAPRPPAKNSPAPDLPVVTPEPLGDVATYGLAALGLSRSPLTAAEQRTMLGPFDPAQYSILPQGEVYISHVHRRRRMIEAVGVGSWGMNPATLPRTEKKDNQVIFSQTFDLYVRGVPVGRAEGKASYSTRNQRASAAYALSALESDAFNRIAGKILGMGLECWDPDFQMRYKMEHGFLVKCKRGRNEKSEWRACHSKRLDGEFDIDPRSPNKDRYTRPEASERAASARWRERSERDDQVARRHDQVAERAKPRAEAPGADKPIPPAAIQQIMRAAESSGLTVDDVKTFIKKQYGHDHRNQIRRSEFNKVMDYCKAPYDMDDADVLDGEVVKE